MMPIKGILQGRQELQDAGGRPIPGGDHVVTIIHVEEQDGEPMGDVVTSSIITPDETTPGAAIFRSQDRALNLIRALGYAGAVRFTDLKGDVGIYDSTPRSDL